MHYCVACTQTGILRNAWKVNKIFTTNLVHRCFEFCWIFVFLCQFYILVIINNLLIKCNIEECSFDTSTHKNLFLLQSKASNKGLQTNYFEITEFISTYGIIIRLHVVLMVRLPIINGDQQLKKTHLIGTWVYIWHPFISPSKNW